jgi:hypothetical protein
MKRGDLVVDLDMLYMAVSMQPMHDTPDELLRVVWEVRDFLYGLITQRKGEWATAWVIAALPKAKQRELLINELSAELIEIDTDEAACIRNIMADDSRLDKVKHVEIVKNYWRQFEKS